MSKALELGKVREVCGSVLAPAHFFVAAPLQLTLDAAVAEESWEIFQGRLLDPAQTRLQRRFESWTAWIAGPQASPPGPLLSVKLDAEAGLVHLVRAIFCHAWEGYHAGGNVYLSRETKKWVREWVGAVRLDECDGLEDLRQRLAERLFRAVVGLSRLPLTSVETPLPAFVLGQVGYFPRPDADADADTPPMHSVHDLVEHGLHAGLGWLEKVKLLELVLRAAAPHALADALAGFVRRWQALGHAPAELTALFRTLFDEVSLSPWTDFTRSALEALRLFVAAGQMTRAEQVDFLGYLLRHLGRHLTAYDLDTFHHLGANYPDALLLDLVLKEYLALAEQQPELFESRPGEATERDQRLRRRALRHGCLFRLHYQGHLVPDAPTSPGEAARVWPAPHLRVPEEQIVNPLKRRRRLYADDPLGPYLGPRARQVLRQSLADLAHPAEQRELGMALFLDRPLGVHLPPGAPDPTLLFSYEAYSSSVARRRLAWLERLQQELLEPAERVAVVLEAAPTVGLPLAPAGRVYGPRIVSLDDAFRSASDWQLLRTSRRSVADFLAAYDFRALAERVPLEFLAADKPLVAIRDPAAAGIVRVHDSAGRPRLELQVMPQAESDLPRPAPPLRVLRAWDAAGRLLDGPEGAFLAPRSR